MEPGIFVEAKPVGLGKWHSYLVYRDGKGNAFVIRGHPEGSGRKFGSGGAIGKSFFGGNLELEVNIPLEDSRDAYGPGENPETRRSQRLDIGDRSPEEVWAAMVAHGHKLANTEMEYDTNVIEPSQNSNSVVRSVQKAVGISLEKGLPKGLDLDDMPGIKRDLSNPRGPERYQREYDELMKDLHERRELKRKGSWPGLPPKDEPARVPDVPVSSNDRSGVPAPPPGTPPQESPTNTALLERKAVQRKIAASPQTPQEILAKPFRKVTEDEIGQLIGAEGYWERGMPLHGKLQDYVRGWMDDAYGTGPLQYDGVGQMIRPQPAYTLATQPVAARGPDGVSVDSGLKRIGERLADRHRGEGETVEDTVSALQTALNEMPDEGSRLRIDGDLGPVTTSRLRRAVLNAGARPVLDALAHAWPGKRRRAA